MKISKSFEIQERAQTPREKIENQTRVLKKNQTGKNFSPPTRKFFCRQDKKEFRELKHLSELADKQLNF